MISYQKSQQGMEKKERKMRMSVIVKNRQEVQTILESQQYIPNQEVIYAVFNAMRLNMPILIEGPAGTGKTELAKVLHQALNWELLRVQCYEGIDFSKVLYEYNYAKQMITINALQSKINEGMVGLSLDESINHFEEDTNFFDERFLLKRPLLKAIEGDERKILLIDEIDKSDEEFEALLLEFLGEFSVSIPEYQTISCPKGREPIVILTSNANRELSEALKRRCIYLYIDYPSQEVESRIIAEKAQVDEAFAQKVAQAVKNIRSIKSLKQKPSIAESIMWAKSLLIHLGEEPFDESNKESIDWTLNVLLKNQLDIDRVKANRYLASV